MWVACVFASFWILVSRADDSLCWFDGDRAAWDWVMFLRRLSWHELLAREWKPEETALLLGDVNCSENKPIFT